MLVKFNNVVFDHTALHSAKQHNQVVFLYLTFGEESIQFNSEAEAEEQLKELYRTIHSIETGKDLVYVPESQNSKVREVLDTVTSKLESTVSKAKGKLFSAALSKVTSKAVDAFNETKDKVQSTIDDAKTKFEEGKLSADEMIKRSDARVNEILDQLFDKIEEAQQSVTKPNQVIDEVEVEEVEVPKPTTKKKKSEKTKSLLDDSDVFGTDRSTKKKADKKEPAIDFENTVIGDLTVEELEDIISREIDRALESPRVKDLIGTQNLSKFEVDELMKVYKSMVVDTAMANSHLTIGELLAQLLGK